jgi:hypothetical protein
MSILVSVPSISFEMSKKMHSDDGYAIFLPFVHEGPKSLDAFSELDQVIGPGIYCVNVPNVCLSEKSAKGISGPSSTEELFVPPSLEEELELGTYDQWRPYPAESLNSYSESMARKMTRKRIKGFAKIAKTKPWKSLIYVEHSAASVCHLSEELASGLAARVYGAVQGLSCELPTSNYVFFSPYGPGGQPGFVTTNRVDPSKVCGWDGIRSYVLGRL